VRLADATEQDRHWCQADMAFELSTVDDGCRTETVGCTGFVLWGGDEAPDTRSQVKSIGVIRDSTHRSGGQPAVHRDAATA